MNMQQMNPAQLDKELQRLEREVAVAKKAADEQRATDEAAAAEEARVEAERLAAERAAQDKREALFRAAAQKQAEMDDLLRQREQLRLDTLRGAAERSAAGLLSRAEEDYLSYGPGNGDIRSSSDDELCLQSARVFRQILGLDVPAELFAVVEPGSIAEVRFLGATWTVTFTPNDGAFLFLTEPRPVQDHGGGSANVHAIYALATLWRVVSESSGLAELKATDGAAELLVAAEPEPVASAVPVAADAAKRGWRR